VGPRAGPRSQPLDARLAEASTLAGLDDPLVAAAVELLRGWDGHREDRDRDGAYADQAVIALFEEWWSRGAARGVRHSGC